MPELNLTSLNIDSLNLLTLEKSGRFDNAIAYSGDVIYPKELPEGVIIDLSQTKISKSVPLLFSHQPYDVAGITESTTIENNALLASGQLAKNNEFADVIKSKEDWQLSIGVFANRSEKLTGSDSKVINGRTVKAPVTVWSDAHVKEISVTQYPVDPNTKIKFFAKKEDVNMADEALEVLKLQLSTKDDEISSLTAILAEKDKLISELQAKISAIETAQAEAKLSYRKDKIKQFCTEKGLSDKESDYEFMLELSDDKFNAALNTISNLKPTLPEHLTKLSHGEKIPDNVPKLRPANDIYAERNRKLGK